jgi:hypothetical protein
VTILREPYFTSVIRFASDGDKRQTPDATGRKNNATVRQKMRPVKERRMEEERCRPLAAFVALKGSMRVAMGLVKSDCMP